MLQQFINIPPDRLAQAAAETVYMLGWSLFFGAIAGIPFGILLVLTKKGGIIENKLFYTLFNGLINLVRSVPFIILLVSIAPFTKIITGTRIGTRAAIVPLVFYLAPYLARLVESSLLEVDDGIIEAALSMGASPLQVIRYFLLPEALGSLILALTTGTIGLLGATTMAGTIGGGGIGDLAVTYGYQRFNDQLMLVTVLVLIVFVQLIQAAGGRLAARIRNHE